MTQANLVYEEHMALVKHVIKTKFPSYVGTSEYEDVAQEGYIGLYKAFQKYDSNTGYQFSTLAVTYIEGAIKRYKRDIENNLIRVPRQQKMLGNKLKYLMGKYPEADSKQLAVLTKSTEDEVNQAMLMILRTFPVELDKDVLEDGCGRPVDLNVLAGVDDRGFENIEFMADLERYLDNFPVKHKEVVLRRLQNYKQQEIADELGLSQVKVSRILAKVSKGLQEVLV